jgi:hypothetical protein
MDEYNLKQLLTRHAHKCSTLAQRLEGITYTREQLCAEETHLIRVVSLPLIQEIFDNALVQYLSHGPTRGFASLEETLINSVYHE